MTGSFLDTTIVVELADSVRNKASAAAHIASHQPAAAPYYAFRELLAGHVQNLCDAHNIVAGAQTTAEALLALLHRSPAEGRKKEAKLQAFAEALNNAFEIMPSGSRASTKREMLEWLAFRVVGLWRRAQKINGVGKLQSLSCFNDGNISYGPSGELRGPRDSFNCIKSQRCSAAAYLYDDKSNIVKMIEALHPNKLTDPIASKRETKQRRKALRELLLKGPKDFDKGRCRALGDAYFAAMCPPGYDVVTTNIVDYQPLCDALAKQAVVP